MAVSNSIFAQATTVTKSLTALDFSADSHTLSVSYSSATGHGTISYGGTTTQFGGCSNAFKGAVWEAGRQLSSGRDLTDQEVLDLVTKITKGAESNTSALVKKTAALDALRGFSFEAQDVIDDFNTLEAARVEARDTAGELTSDSVQANFAAMTRAEKLVVADKYMKALDIGDLEYLSTLPGSGGREGAEDGALYLLNDVVSNLGQGMFTTDGEVTAKSSAALASALGLTLQQLAVVDNDGKFVGDSQGATLLTSDNVLAKFDSLPEAELQEMMKVWYDLTDENTDGIDGAGLMSVFMDRVHETLTDGSSSAPELVAAVFNINATMSAIDLDEIRIIGVGNEVYSHDVGFGG